jgi:hypothetical protein
MGKESLLDSLGKKLNQAGKEASSAIKKAIGVGADPSSKTIAFGGELPWKNQKDAFFAPAEIDGRRWNRIYPYRLLVIDVKNNNKIVGPGADSGANAIEYRSQVDSGNIIVQYQSKWEFRLPITPQQISFVSDYAITTTPTLRGIIEEHGGLRFKTISMQGTFGIWPTRPQFDRPATETSIQSLISGTTAALGRLADSVRKTVKAFTGQSPYNTPKPAEPEFLTETGYYNAKLLDQFLEQYAIAKKDPRNSGWRLVFDVPKDNQSFVVTPVSLNIYKNANKPTEEMYNLQLRAWKRINLEKTESGIPPQIPGLDTNTYKNILEGIRQARIAAQNSLNLIKAVRSDFQKPLNALREASLFVKDLGGVAQAASELPRQIVKDYQSGISEAIQNTSEGLANLGDGLIKTLTLGLVKTSGKFESRSLSSVQANSKALSNNIESDPAYNMFNNPESAFTLFEKLDMDEVPLTDEQRLSFENEIDRVRNYNIDDLRDIRSTIYNLALDISNEFGANDATLNSILGRAAPKVRLTEMTVEENEVLAAMIEAVTQMDILTATRAVDENRRVNPLQYVGDYAAEAGIPFEANSSAKILVPVPFGKSLEEISLRYLGDVNRWIEIATLNALRDPYIDEEGFSYPLLSNGDGRQVIVNTNEGLFAGQRIQFSSLTVPAFSRKITAIEQIGSSTNYLITVDGLPDLDVLLLSDSASLRGYTPGTVNSQDQIYIPTDLPAEPDDYARQVPGIEVSTIVGLSKIDILLTEDFDIAINNQGDMRLAAGLTNLIQALKIKLFTERGSVLTDPTFGIGITPGRNIADIDVNNLLKDIGGLILKDPRFETIDKLEINLNGSVLEISIKVVLANRLGVIPITFLSQ